VSDKGSTASRIKITRQITAILTKPAISRTR
jgi:hypothetical protein